MFDCVTVDLSFPLGRELIYKEDRRSGGNREKEGERGTNSRDQGKHTREMLALAAGLNCLIIVTGCSTRNNSAIAAVITTTTISTPSTTTAMPLSWRWMVHHKIGNLWSFTPKVILTEGFTTKDQQKT